MQAAGTRSALDYRTFAVPMLVLVMIATAWGTVNSPWLITGAVLGLVVLVVALTAPLVMVGAMLAFGAIDLSFLTGGFKALFPHLGGLDMNGIRLLAATAGFLTYILFEPRARAAAAGSLGRMYIVFLAFALGTIAYSMDPLEGLRLGLKLAYPLLTFLIVVGVCYTRERLETLMRYVLISVAFIAFILNPILVLKGEYRVDAGIVRLGGLGIGDNPFAFYCMGMLFIVFTRYLLRRQLGYLLLSAVLFAWMALTQTRIAAAGAIVGLAIIGALTAFSTGNRKILVGAALTATIAGLIVVPQVLVRSFGYLPSPGEIAGLIAHPAALYESINWQGRELLWAILWAAFLKSPMVGLGLGSSTAVIRVTFPDQGVKVAHSEYMRLGTDTGVIGVALFAVAICTWLAATVRLALRGDRMTREFAFPAVAAIIGWAIISMMDNPFDYYILYIQYIGFLVAVAVVMNSTAPAQMPAEIR